VSRFRRAKANALQVSIRAPARGATKRRQLSGCAIRRFDPRSLSPTQRDQLPLIIIKNGKKEIGHRSGRNVRLINMDCHRGRLYCAAACRDNRARFFTIGLPRLLDALLLAPPPEGAGPTASFSSLMMWTASP
jgi:hypothetical protein